MDLQSEIFARNLKARRRELGLTQKKLAELIEYSEKSVSKWESGYAIAPSAVLPLLAKRLETSIDSLLSAGLEEFYYLGIDGGGTKTEIALADSAGTIISRALLDGCNPVDIGITRTLEILTRGIAAACSNVPNSRISVFAGISGGITGDNKERIHAFLEKYNFHKIGNGSDAESAVALALGDEDGTAVIMGTGSIAFKRTAGVLKRFGGYGYLFDDGGSGFSIGRDAIIAALQCEEGRGEKTVLLPLLKKKMETDNLLSQLGKFYEGGKRIVASFAPLVFEAYKSADAVATRILTENMRAIADLIKDAPVVNGKHRAVLVGGLTKDADILIPLIKRFLPRPMDYDLSNDSRAPIFGALKLAGARIDKE